MKICTDLEGIFSGNVIVHRQHGYTKAWQEDTAENPLLFFIYRGKTKHSVYIYIYTHYIVNSYLKALFVNRTQVKWTVKGKTVQCFGQINIGYQVKTLEKMSTDSVLYAARLL